MLACCIIMWGVHCKLLSKHLLRHLGKQTKKKKNPFKWATYVSLFETGWDLGPFAVVLQCLHLDTPLPELQNTKKLYGTKNNCMHAQLGQIIDRKIQKDQKNPTTTSE